MFRHLLSVILLAAAMSLTLAAPARAAERDFILRYSHNGWANVVHAGNVLLKCPASDPRCAGIQTGSGTENNNVFLMEYVDVDSDPATFNSSTARVSIPPGATIDFAMLYWGGDTAHGTNRPFRCSDPSAPPAVLPPDPAAADQVLVSTAGGPYTPVTAASFDFSVQNIGQPFQGSAEITHLFSGYSVRPP